MASGAMTGVTAMFKTFLLLSLAIVGVLALVLTDCRRTQGSSEGAAGKTSGAGGGEGMGAEKDKGTGAEEDKGAGKTPREKRPTAKPLLEYSRSGGFGGFDDHLVIEKSGTGTVTRRSGSRKVHLEKSRVEQVVAALEKAGFAGLKSEYLAHGADMFTYRISYKGHTVTAMDSAVPDVLEPILRMLNEIVDGSGVTPRG